MDTGGLDLFEKAGGWVAAAIFAITTFFGQKKKTEVDEVSMVLENWKALTEKHQEQLRLLTAEVIGLRNRVHQLEEELTERLREIRSLKLELDREKDRISTEVAKRLMSKTSGIDDGKLKKKE